MVCVPDPADAQPIVKELVAVGVAYSSAVGLSLIVTCTT